MDNLRFYVIDQTFFWIGVSLIAFAALTFVGNICIAVDVLRTKKSASMICAVSGLLGCAGVFLAFPEWRAWCWVPLFLDVTCVPMIAWAVYEHNFGSNSRKQ